MGRLKFLTVCDAGMNRSHTLAIVLKQAFHEAHAIGRMNCEPETMEMMCNWADVIVLMEPHMKESIAEKWHDKLHVIDTGPDVYGRPGHPDLYKICREGAEYMFFKLKKEGKL